MENLYREISNLGMNEYPDIVEDTHIHHTSSGTPAKLRVYIVDGSYLDIWLSGSGKYSYHWEHRHITGQIHRHDNAPHPKWSHVKTFPKHYHEGSDNSVHESYLPDDPMQAARIILTFIRERLGEGQLNPTQ
ncbi:MAG: DUF6516 family protein [Candidatus Bathyarchaeota archaeon]